MIRPLIALLTLIGLISLIIFPPAIAEDGGAAADGGPPGNKTIALLWEQTVEPDGCGESASWCG